MGEGMMDASEIQLGKLRRILYDADNFISLFTKEGVSRANALRRLSQGLEIVDALRGRIDPTPNLEEATLREILAEIWLESFPAGHAKHILEGSKATETLPLYMIFKAMRRAALLSTPTLRDDVIEECARICDELDRHAMTGFYDAEDCALAIRRLKSAQPPLTEVER
jgi:hypothetical protein